MEAGRGQRLVDGTVFPRRDPGGSVRASVLVELVHDSILVCCVLASCGLSRVHKQAARPGVHDPDILAAAFEEAALKLSASQLAPQELSIIAWAFGRLGVNNPTLFMLW
ncbi:unnamed protein product [Polarella glacialis]|uniref:Uncharacterized protein n=1 Tax=Polarella glacialis TaxID=89957 RepID=A0A813IM37_POLGL|nr:unnamed protein product [Polarella glacialis]